MKSKILKGIVSVALLGGAVSSFAGPGIADGAPKFLGNITTNGQVRSDFGTYWNQITAENECKWASIEGTRGSYNFSGCDRAYKWAKDNGGHFKFHALVWGSQYPSWLERLNVADTKTAITNWMDAVAKHYPDLEMIDVVNEAIRTGAGQYHSGYTKTKIIEALGGDNNGDYKFVTTAFNMARERWPKAILIYNDYNTVQWQKDQGIDLINTIKKNGAPVDAYGLQAHDMMSQGGGAGGVGGGGSCLNINTLKSVINEIWTKTQTPMFISEYDIATENDAVQKQCYQEQISYFMENEHIAGVTLWGYIYGSTWTTNGNSGLIKNGQDRPAMTWLKDYFKNNVNDIKENTGLFGEYVPPEPPPDPTPYKGTAATIPGKVEVENYDEGGSMSGYSDDDSENKGDAAFRESEGVDVVKGGSGMAVGYTATGEWLHYTVNVTADDEYTITANVSSGAASSGFKVEIDGKLVGSVDVPKTGEDWSVYESVSVGKVSLTKGKHAIKITITGDNCNIDYLEFSKGDPASGFIAQNKKVQMNVTELSDYYVFDVNGVRMGRMSAYTMDEAVMTLKNTNAIKVQGIYLLRSVKNGEVKSVRVAR